MPFFIFREWYLKITGRRSNKILRYRGFLGISKDFFFLSRKEAKAQREV